MRQTNQRIVFAGLLAAACVAATVHAEDRKPQPSYLTMSLAQLLRIDLALPSSLILTDLRLAPAAVTLIDHRDITSSGARNLDELLDIYVPGFQFLKKQNGNMMGIRGIISDRNNKMLMLVNGRNMNIKATGGGALPERLLSMLGDIRRITVVRGPGSAVAGPGAIAGVINIETYNGLNFQGTETVFRAGAFEEFGSFEIKHGTKLANDVGLFLYYGVDNYAGADQDDAGLIFSSPFTTRDGIYTAPGESPTFDVNNSNNSYDDRLRHKAHVQLTGDNFDTWIRYTRGGMRAAQNRTVYTVDNDLGAFLDTGVGYDQLTVFGRYHEQISDLLKLEAETSFDTADVVLTSKWPVKYWREDEYLAKVMATLTPSPDHTTAVGFEYSHEMFGKRNRDEGGGPRRAAQVFRPVPNGTRTHTPQCSSTSGPSANIGLPSWGFAPTSTRTRRGCFHPGQRSS